MPASRLLLLFFVCRAGPSLRFAPLGGAAGIDFETRET